MLQVVQSLSNGKTQIIEIPCPDISENEILIRTKCSLISSGTERMLVKFGKSNYLEKALSQPEKVKQVFEKLSSNGIFSTFDAIKTKLDEPLPLGYCNVGEVVKTGNNIKDFKVGDRVVSNGPHAQFVSVPEKLCAHIPKAVDDETASFTVLGSIALQGIRLAKPTIGETFLISGLGIIGFLTAKILEDNGCNVLAVDTNYEKCKIAKSLGINVLHIKKDTNIVDWCLRETDNIGVDGVLISASTSSSEPVNIAANACRKRGRIVLIGVTGLELNRELFYKKELTFQVSCSYGPGRYDDNYEKNNNDYPIGYIRWTEQRNFKSVLNCFSKSPLKTENLISQKFNIKEINKAYKFLLDNPSSLGLIINYPENPTPISTINFEYKNNKISNKSLSNYISFIGAGNYASRVLIPAFKKAGANMHTLAALHGVNSSLIGKKNSFNYVSTDIKKVLSDRETNSIVIATRHDSHADLVIKALENKKNVYVEKPLCLTADELKSISKKINSSQILMVGFNRRFAPFILDIKKIISRIKSPKAFNFTCNAGYIEEDHWTQDPKIGGGRLIGEACHFVDLLRYLSSSSIKKMNLVSCSDNKKNPDTFCLQISFSNGDIGTINYFSNGNKKYPKERLEVYANKSVIVMDNYLKLKSWGIKNFKNKRSYFPNKGNKECVEAFLSAINNKKESPIPFNEIFEVQKFLLEINNQDHL